MAEHDDIQAAERSSGDPPGPAPAVDPGAGGAPQEDRPCRDRPRPCGEASSADGDTEAETDFDFTTFVLSLATSAYMHLGKAPPPPGETVTVNLQLAKQTIDILGMLEQKTRCNLTEREASLLQRVLFDLRMQFLEERDS